MKLLVTSLEFIFPVFSLDVVTQDLVFSFQLIEVGRTVTSMFRL
jgi:hypothetical protein